MIDKETLEQQIPVERENVVIGGGAVNSVNGKTGDVVLNAEDVGALPDSTVIPTVNDATLTIQKNGSTVATFSANSDSDQTANITVPTAVADFSDANDYAKAADLEAETAAREGADTGLQSQIDAISASSDVTDIVGTYAELQSYDTSTLGNNDIIKVLQDESRNNETTYYRWSTATQTFTLIGEEGPYYTKSAADAKFQDKLTAGANISIDANNEISATDTTYTAGTNVQISPSNVISATDTTYSDFTGTDGSAAGVSGLVPAPATTDADKFLKSDGTWDSVQAGPTVVQTTGTSTTDVMSQKAVTNMIYPEGYETSKTRIVIGDVGRASANNALALGPATASGVRSIAIAPAYNSGSYVAEGTGAINIGGSYARGTGSIVLGEGASTSGFPNYALCVGYSAQTSHNYSVTLGSNTKTTRASEVSIGDGSTNANYGTRYLANVTDPTLPQDAATKNYVDGKIITGGTTAPDSTTVGKVGTLYAWVENGAGKLSICTDDTGGTYTWSSLV